MLWLDNFLAAPVLGVSLIPTYREMMAFQKGATDFMQSYFEEFNEHECESIDIWGYKITAPKSGVAFNLSPRNVVAKYTYKAARQETPGKLPRIVFPEVKKYSEILKELIDSLGKFFESLTNVKGFKFDRIGIVTSVNLDKDSMPPGLKYWIEHLEKPLGGELIMSRTHILMLLSKIDNHIDQCHHALEFDLADRPDMGYKLVLDWQRRFKEAVSLESRKILAALKDCENMALQYFEKFAEGGLTDE